MQVLRIQLHTYRKQWRKVRKSVLCTRHRVTYLKCTNGIFQLTPGRVLLSYRVVLRKSLREKTRRIADTKQHRHHRIPNMRLTFNSSFQHFSKNCSKYLGLQRLQRPVCWICTQCTKTAALRLHRQASFSSSWLMMSKLLPVTAMALSLSKHRVSLQMTKAPNSNSH